MVDFTPPLSHRDIFAVLDKAVDINLKSVKDDALQRDLTRLQSSVRTSAQVYDKLDRILNRTFSFQLPSDLYDISWVLFLSYRGTCLAQRSVHTLVLNELFLILQSTPWSLAAQYQNMTFPLL